ncbi:ribonuclease H family protein [Streptomyces radiopugnans]|uniref:ribonuclease H family protein n=1 Tax=Streptomyces radiopugnans TaxID=403935 RepID=UPI003F1B405C
MLERIIAACDGASKGNPGPAAWAWVIAGADGDVERWEAGPLGRATNNVAELTALERLLQVLDPAVPAQVRMDSQYAMKAVTTWLPGWRRKGWKTSAGTPVANRDLVVRIDELLTGRDVEFVYTPAHRADGDRLNDAADRAASHSARTQRPIGSAAGDDLPPPEPGAATAGGRSRPAGAKPARKPGPGGFSGRSLKARFPGRCRCGRPYAKGETIAKNPDGWGHPACAATGAGGT